MRLTSCAWNERDLEFSSSSFCQGKVGPPFYCSNWDRWRSTLSKCFLLNVADMYHAKKFPAL